MNASSNSTPGKYKTSIILDSRPGSSLNAFHYRNKAADANKNHHIYTDKNIYTDNQYAGERDLDINDNKFNEEAQRQILRRSVDNSIMYTDPNDSRHMRPPNRQEDAYNRDNQADSYPPVYNPPVYKQFKPNTGNPWTHLNSNSRSAFRTSSEPPVKKEERSRSGPNALLDSITDIEYSVLEEVEEVLRSSLRLCIRPCAAEFIPSNLTWILQSHGVPMEGSSSGHIWLDVQVRIVRVTLRGQSDYHNRSSRPSRLLTDGIELELTIPTVAEGSRFCLISIIDPSKFRRMQADQRITVDWSLFPTMIGDMLNLCHRNATYEAPGDDLYHDSSIRGSARRPSSYSSGNHMCVLSSNGGTLDLSIIESSTLREIVHLALPMCFADGPILEQHLVRLYVELQEENNKHQKEYLELLETSRQRESHYQRLENIRNSSTTQKITGLERENEQMKKMMVEMKSDVEESEAKANENLMYAMESKTNKENANKYKAELATIREENIELLDKTKSLTMETARLRATLESLEPMAVEELRRVTISQKSLLAECELELANHTQVYSSLNKKIQNLHNVNLKLQTRCDNLENNLEMKHETGNAESKKLSTLKLENERLQETIEEDRQKISVLTNKILNLDHQMNAKSKLIEYLHKELNRVSTGGQAPTQVYQTSPQAPEHAPGKLVSPMPVRPDIPSELKENQQAHSDPLQFMKMLSAGETGGDQGKSGSGHIANKESQENLAKSFNWSQLWQKKAND